MLNSEKRDPAQCYNEKYFAYIVEENNYIAYCSYSAEFLDRALSELQNSVMRDLFCRICNNWERYHGIDQLSLYNLGLYSSETK